MAILGQLLGCLSWSYATSDATWLVAKHEGSLTVQYLLMLPLLSNLGYAGAQIYVWYAKMIWTIPYLIGAIRTNYATLPMVHKLIFNLYWERFPPTSSAPSEQIMILSLWCKISTIDDPELCRCHWNKLWYSSMVCIIWYTKNIWKVLTWLAEQITPLSLWHLKPTFDTRTFGWLLTTLAPSEKLHYFPNGSQILCMLYWYWLILTSSAPSDQSRLLLLWAGYQWRDVPTSFFK